MKKLIVLLSLLSISSFAEVRLVHGTCELAIAPTYTNDGLNVFLTQAAKAHLSKKNFTVSDYATASADAMAMKLDLTTEVDESGKKANCKAVLSLRGTLDEAGSSMLLANIAQKKGSIGSVANKCIAEILKAIKDYPTCSTVLDPDAAQDPVPTPGDDQDPANDDDVDTGANLG